MKIYVSGIVIAASLVTLQIAAASESPIQIFGNAKFSKQRSVADLNGDGIQEIVLVGEAPSIPPSIAGSQFLYVLDQHGNLLPGWPRDLNSLDFVGMSQSPAIGDIDGDGIPEILVSTKVFTFGYTSRLYAFRIDGSSVPGWPIQITDFVTFLSDPVLSDLDGDGDYEIIARHGTGLHVFQGNGAELPGFPVAFPGGPGATPVVGNVDEDSTKEIVIEDRSIGRVAVVSSTGVVKASFSVTDSIAPSHLALINLDSDAALEILHTSNPSPGLPSQIAAYLADGSSIPGWPFTDGLRIFGKPALGDITGDGIAEICFSAVGNGSGSSSVIYALNLQGVPISHFPALAPLYDYNPADTLIGDVTGDGIGDLVFTTLVTTPVFHVEAFALNGQGSPISSFHLEYSLGNSWQISPTMADLDGNGKTCLVHSLSSGISANGYLYVKRLRTSFGIKSHPWPRALGNNQNNAVARN